MDNLMKKQYIFASMFADANKLQTIGDHIFKDITMKQWFAIVCIHFFDYSPNLNEIADRMGCSRQNVKKIISILEEKKLVEITSDKKDTRVSRISLTEKCFLMFKEREDIEKELISTLYKEFTSEEIDFMYRMFIKYEEGINNLQTK